MNRKNRARFLILLLLSIPIFLFQSSCSQSSDIQAVPEVDAPLIGKQFVELVAQKDFAGATGKLDTIERMGLPQERLKSIWENLLAQYGEYQSQTLVTTGTAAKGQTVTIKCAFERGAATVSLTINNSGQIAGVSFTDS